MDPEPEKLINKKETGNHNLLYAPLVYSIISFCFFSILIVASYLVNKNTCDPLTVHFLFTMHVVRCIISNVTFLIIMGCFLVNPKHVRMCFYIITSIFICLSLGDLFLSFLQVGYWDKFCSIEYCKPVTTLFAVFSLSFNGALMSGIYSKKNTIN